MIFNTIHHDIRNAAGLSLLDYCLLESIYRLSRNENTNAIHSGWCNASRKYFNYLGSEATIKRALVKLSKGENPWIVYKDSKRRMLKKTTARYYKEVACYLDGTKKFRAGQSDPVQKVEERVNVTQGAGQCDPLERVNVTPNRDININSNNKTKRVVSSVPKTRAQQFAQAIDQAEFPASFPPNLNAFLKRFFSNLNEMHPQTFNRPQQLNKIIKQVYNIREAGHSDEYLIKLIAKCNEQGWKSVSVDYLKDETNNAKFFNHGGVIRPNSVKIN